MEENKKQTTLTQKDYQKKYDKKTKMVSVKYVLSDMQDYMRLKEYLDRTGQTANSFIKDLINDFFERKKYEINEERIADYYKDYNVDIELLEKLKTMVGNERFDIIMNYYKSEMESEIYNAFIGKGECFDEWIEQFLLDVECRDIDINVSDDEFRKIISHSMSESMGYIACYV
jgi:hypothetical protein